MSLAETRASVGSLAISSIGTKSSHMKLGTNFASP